MGYLQISATAFAGVLGNFPKAVISAWFRVPAATLSAVRALTDSPPDSYGDGWEGAAFTPPMYKVIPLITFGSLETTSGIGGADASVPGDLPISPSFIGIDCSQIQADGASSYINGKTVPTLAVNLQTPDFLSYNKPPVAPEGEVRPIAYYMRGIEGSDGGGESLNVAADTWHHALISFDVSGGSSITWANVNRSPPDPTYAMTTGGPKFRWAFNDVGKNGFSRLPAIAGAYVGSAGGSGPDVDADQLIPSGFMNIVSSGDTFSTPIETSTDFVITQSISVGIAAEGKAVGIPTIAAFVDSIHQVEMAEFQMWTGVYVDPSDLATRRAFIKADGTPETNYSVADALLGKSPEIRLRGSSNWKVGNNSGTIGNFSKIGTINTYTARPDLSP